MKAIVAADKNWGIGKDNGLLFRLGPDQKRFRRLTMGKTVVMGRTTFESLPGRRPLEGRKNIILTSDLSYMAGGAFVVHSLDQLMWAVSGTDTDDIFVIGGERVYRLLLPYIKTVYVTKIYAESAEADRFFPNLDDDGGWKGAPLSEVEEWEGVKYQYFEYTNLAPQKYEAPETVKERAEPRIAPRAAGVDLDIFTRLADELTCELPEVFFDRLNGGVNIIEYIKLHPDSSLDNPLYILGEYSSSPQTGRCIYIYYGSFMRMYPHAPEGAMKRRLRSTLRHEFRHHLESLAGDASLAREDEERLDKYLGRE